jgi:Domain of unknown function (DUF4177)
MTTSVRTTWEYKLEALEFSPLDFDEHTQLNELGAEGWELVSIQPSPSAGAAPFLCIFKRQSC